MRIAPTNNGKKLSQEIFAFFDCIGENYLEDDIRWGDDTDLIYYHGEKLKQKLGRLIDIFYPGVGPGHILIQILTKRRFFRKITAIDYSPNMVKLSQKRLSKLAKLDSKIKDLVELKKKDLFQLQKYDEKYDMALLLNNTLGNIVVDNSGEQGRKVALEIINKLLHRRRLLFLSIYNIEKMRLINSFYTSKLKLVEKLTPQDFLLEANINDKKYKFYSHWFTVEEIKNLLTQTGFIPSSITMRKERIIVCAEKR